LSQSTSHFLWRDFQDRVSQTICLGLAFNSILLISASWVARIIAVSHWHLANVNFFWGSVSLCSSVWLHTHNLPFPTSWVLGL
jgi:hypothetical protein